MSAKTQSTESHADGQPLGETISSSMISGKSHVCARANAMLFTDKTFLIRTTTSQLYRYRHQLHVPLSHARPFVFTIKESLR